MSVILCKYILLFVFICGVRACDGADALIARTRAAGRLMCTRVLALIACANPIPTLHATVVTNGIKYVIIEQCYSEQ